METALLNTERVISEAGLNNPALTQVYKGVNGRLKTQAKTNTTVIPAKEIWISVQETIRLLSITKKTCCANCKNGKYTTKLVSGNGGKQYRILLSSLSYATQQKYYEERGITFTPEQTEDEIKSAVDMDAYTNAPVYARKKADKYLSIIKASEGLKGEELKDFIKEWNRKNPAQKTSYQRLVDARNKYKEQGISGLLAGYGAKAGKTKISTEDYDYFKSLYLKEGSPTLQSCFNSTYGAAIKRNEGEIPEDFPSPSAFLRLLERNVPKQFIYAARRGQSAWNKKFHSFVERDFENKPAGSVWVSDHRQIDVAMIYKLPENANQNVRRLLESVESKYRKPVFPWITVWSDFKTGKWLGWYLHAEDPNSDHIFQAFYNAVSEYGLPSDIIIDNGKDYRSKDFAGGKRRKVEYNVDENKTRSLMAALNITVHFAQPYNGQTKPIERDFRIQKEWFDKLMPGYRGGNIRERPEILAAEIKQGKIIDIADYSDILDVYVNEILHKYPCYGKKHKGKTRDELWNEEFKGGRKISMDALKLFCMRTSPTPQSIGRNGIVVSRQHSLYYWAEWMIAQKGRKVYMRRDNNKYQEAWVFDDKTGDYLGRAVLNGWTCAALAETDLEKKQLRDVLKAKKLEENLMKEYISRPNKIDPVEIINNMATGIAAGKKETDEEKPLKTNVIIKTFMDEVKLQDETMERTGTHGNISIADLAVNKEEKKSKIYTFAFEKEAAERNE